MVVYCKVFWKQGVGSSERRWANRALLIVMLGEGRGGVVLGPEGARWGTAQGCASGAKAGETQRRTYAVGLLQ